MLYFSVINANRSKLRTICIIFSKKKRKITREKLEFLMLISDDENLKYRKFLSKIKYNSKIIYIYV